MNVDFILVASGNALLPRINHALSESYPKGAKIEAHGVVAALHKAGYTSFSLYDTRRKDGSAGVKIAAFRVAHQEPHIIMD